MSSAPAAVEARRPADRRAAKRNWPRILAVGSILVGILIRLAHLLGGRSVHIDEARLALNIGRRSFAGLLRPLDYEQTAPIPFLWIEKVAATLGGVNEIALRFVPFVLGCVLLVLIYQLAQRVLPAAGWPLAGALGAVSPVLVHYSNEIKPYIGDSVFATGLAILAVDLLRVPSRSGFLRFGVIATIAVASSAPAIFVVVGLSFVVGYYNWRTAPWLVRRLAWSALLCITLFGVTYFAFYRPMSTHPYMRHFWGPAFLTGGEGRLLPRIWGMLSEVIWGSFMGGYVHGVRERLILVAVAMAASGLSFLMIGGALYLRRLRGGPVVALLLAPLAVTIAASIAGTYPISLRLVLHTVPIIILFVVAGVLFAAARTSPSRRVAILCVLAVTLLVRPTLRSVLPRFWPYHRQELRSLVRSYEERGKGEPVYVFANAIPAWLYYTTDWKAPDYLRLDSIARVASVGGPSFENAGPRAAPVVDEGQGLLYKYQGRTEILGIPTGDQWRVIVGSKWGRPDPGWERNESRRILAIANPAVWIVFSHFRGSENGLLEELEKMGLQQTESVTQPGAHLFRYSR